MSLQKKVGLQLRNCDVHVEVWHDPKLSSGQKHPQTKQKTSQWSKIPTESIYRKLLSVARKALTTIARFPVLRVQDKVKKPKPADFFSLPIIPIN